MRSWEDSRAKLGLDEHKKNYWRQGKFIHTIPHAWKEMLLECGNNISYLINNKHHLIKKHQIYCLGKLNSRQLYNMQLIYITYNLSLTYIYIYIYIYICIYYMDMFKKHRQDCDCEHSNSQLLFCHQICLFLLLIGKVRFIIKKKEMT